MLGLIYRFGYSYLKENSIIRCYPDVYGEVRIWICWGVRFKVSKCRVGDAKSRDVPARMAVQQKVFSVEIAVRKDLM